MISMEHESSSGSSDSEESMCSEEIEVEGYAETILVHGKHKVRCSISTHNYYKFYSYPLDSCRIINLQ